MAHTAQSTGIGGWAGAYAQARSVVVGLTNNEKNSLLYGSGIGVNGCSGFSGNLTRVSYTGLCLQDAESGVRTGNLVNGYPAQLAVGSSWNRDLAYARAKYIGAEFKAKGVNVLLGPVVGPLGRIAKGGRNWEGFSNDPYLAGQLVQQTVSGMQESVIACVKHFIGYEQETNRLPFAAGQLEPLGLRANQSVSSNIGDRAMHELYLWPFYDAVRAGVGSVMASYNKVNGSDASANSKNLNGLLKTELGFQGFVVSDWYGQHTGVASANAGLDMAMPSSSFWDSNKLAQAVSNGSMTSARLDDMVTRILAAWYRYAQLSTPGMTPNANVDARDPASEDTILQSAIEGHVLVKNINNALPLSKPKSLSLFGWDAVGGINDTTTSFKYPFGLTNTQTYDNGVAFTDLGTALLFASLSRVGSAGPAAALNGTLITGGGSGAITPNASIAPYDAFVTQAAIDGTVLKTDFISVNPNVDPTTDAAIVFVNEQSSESWDRSGLASTYADSLISNVASQHRNTIVVIHNAGIRLVDRWIDNANVTAVLFGHPSGQASGTALTEIIYGRQSPSGRLPYTVAKQESDYGSLLNPSYATPSNPFYSQSDFTEGVFIDYKAFIKNNITPRYAFGYGLTYTTFAYSNLAIAVNSTANTAALPPDALSSSSAVAPEGGLASLYDIVATITATVANTGSTFTAAEVAQLYLGIPTSGVTKVLRGFSKVSVSPGTSVQVNFPLRRRDVSVWDTVAQQWRIPAGAFQVYVGQNVLDQSALTGFFTLI